MKEEDTYLGFYPQDTFFGLPMISDSQLNQFSIGTELESIEVLQEETMDVATRFAAIEPPLNVYIPVARRGAPERQRMAGALDFQVEINAADTHKTKFLFSNELNRIYVQMKTSFSVQFRWEAARAPRPLLVRSTVVFADVSHAEKRVERCTQHTHETHAPDLSMAVIKNVLHSSRDMSTPGVYYCGAPEHADSWYSMLVEFPGAGAGPFRHAYQFVCKNSCSSGINRRAIDIIFELEDTSGFVHGRQTVGARVCSCPRRDIKRDEADRRGTKREAEPQAPAAAPARGKKVKLEVAPVGDDEVVEAQVSVVGVRSLLAGLHAMLGVMEYDAARSPQAVEKYNAHIAELKRQIEHYKGVKPQ